MTIRRPVGARKGDILELFDKKKLPEIEAAGHFVITIAKDVQEHWSSIVAELNEIFKSDDSISDDEYTGFEFTLAVISTQIQALNNLLPKDQADRIREYILQCISSPELGSYPRDTIAEYQNAWDESISQGEPPFFGVASVLYDKLECKDKVELENAKFKSPLMLMALSEKTVKFAGSWWRDVTQKFKLVR